MVDDAQPAWLKALIAQMYPGQGDMSSAQLEHMINAPGPWHGGGTPNGPILPIRPDYSQPNIFPQVNQPGSIQALRGSNAAFPPGPPSPFPAVNMSPGVQQLDPRLSGGAPAVANKPPVNPSLSASTTPQQQGVIPGQQRVNRAGNNPNYSTFQYDVPGSQRGANAPIYTAANFGNLFGGGQQSQQPHPQVQGALANPNWADSSRVGPFPQNLFQNAQRMGPFPQSLFARGQQMGPSLPPDMARASILQPDTYG